MWISFTCLAVFIVLLFWILLGNSVRNNYKSENTSGLEHTAWTIAQNYGQDDFENNLKLISESEKCFIQIVSEENSILSMYGGDENFNQTDGTVAEDIFIKLDNSNGWLTYYIEDDIRNIEYVVRVVVLANWQGSREILVISKSLANVDYMMQIISSRLIFALIGAIIVASILSFIITRYFTSPINRLTEQAREMAEGNYRVTFSEDGFYEVRELSNTLKKAAEEFDATEALRKDFVANISHDMKTPLTVIKMSAEMIQTVSGEDREKRNMQLDRILKESEKLRDFIDDTMYLSKLQSKTMPFTMDKVNLSNLIKSVIFSFEVHMVSENVQMEFVLDNDMIVMGDAKLLERVLNNFISNALKYSGENKKIIIKGFSKNGEIVVEIYDNGIGIEKEKIENIWQRYYQVDNYYTTKVGMGIGLHIVKEILELHGAKYGAESEVGVGSKFWFSMEEI